MEKADASRQRAISSCTSVAQGGTPLSCLSKRQGSIHQRPSSHLCRALRRASTETLWHQWSASHSTHHKHLRWELSLPAPSKSLPIPAPVYWAERAGGGISPWIQLILVSPFLVSWGTLTSQMSAGNTMQQRGNRLGDSWGAWRKTFWCKGWGSQVPHLTPCLQTGKHAWVMRWLEAALSTKIKKW